MPRAVDRCSEPMTAAVGIAAAVEGRGVQGGALAAHRSSWRRTQLQASKASRQ